MPPRMMRAARDDDDTDFERPFKRPRTTLPDGSIHSQESELLYPCCQTMPCSCIPYDGQAAEGFQGYRSDSGYCSNSSLPPYDSSDGGETHDEHATIDPRLLSIGALEGNSLHHGSLRQPTWIPRNQYRDQKKCWDEMSNMILTEYKEKKRDAAKASEEWKNTTIYNFKHPPCPIIYPPFCPSTSEQVKWIEEKMMEARTCLSMVQSDRRKYICDKRYRERKGPLLRVILGPHSEKLAAGEARKARRCWWNILLSKSPFTMERMNKTTLRILQRSSPWEPEYQHWQVRKGFESKLKTELFEEDIETEDEEDDSEEDDDEDDNDEEEDEDPSDLPEGAGEIEFDVGPAE